LLWNNEECIVDKLVFVDTTSVELVIQRRRRKRRIEEEGLPGLYLYSER
jgi:hypothetical protein